MRRVHIRTSLMSSSSAVTAPWPARTTVTKLVHVRLDSFIVGDPRGLESSKRLNGSEHRSEVNRSA